MELESYVDSGGHAPDKPPMSRPFSRVEEATDHNMLHSQGRITYMHGARFWLVSAANAILMFLVNLEMTVVNTALVAITNELGGLDSVSWVVASYLLGYVAVLVIFAKFSDIFGRKLIFLLSAALFIIFSAACGASQTMLQLVVFRAFQGLGGGGCFSLSTVMVTELVPSEQYTQYVSYMSIVTTLALLLGPIVGGAIAVGATWRWIFLINIPIGLIAFLIAFFTIPNGFPYHGQPNRPRWGWRDLVRKTTLDRIDVPGTVLLLFATLALTAGFEEADSRFPWKSAYVICLLTISGGGGARY